jgi:hypothetical protein
MTEHKPRIGDECIVHKMGCSALPATVTQVTRGCVGFYVRFADGRIVAATQADVVRWIEREETGGLDL